MMSNSNLSLTLLLPRQSYISDSNPMSLSPQHDYDMRVDDFLRRTQAVVSSRRQRSDRAPRSGGGEGGASAPSTRRGERSRDRERPRERDRDKERGGASSRYRR